MSNLKLYRHPLSGHAHRVELLLSVLGLEAEIIDVDLMKGEQKAAEFLEKNPEGQVPVLEDDGLYISDSNAILIYLVSKYDHNHQWMPREPHLAAEVQQALTIAAGPVAYGPASARLITLFGASYDVESTIEHAYSVLSTIERRLEDKEWLAAARPTIADIAVYAYVARAPEGNVSLREYPGIRNWLTRIENLDGFVPMQRSPVGLAA